MVKRYDFMMGTLQQCERLDGDFVEYEDYQKLEAENARLRQQRDAANATIQQLNRIIAGDVE